MFFSFQTEKAAVRRAPLITSTWLLPCCLLFHKYHTVLWSAILLLISLLKIEPQPSSGYIGLRHQNFSTIGSHLYGGDQGVGAASIAQMSSLMWVAVAGMVLFPAHFSYLCCPWSPKSWPSLLHHLMLPGLCASAPPRRHLYCRRPNPLWVRAEMH
jgi:hypothetical protein